MNAIQARITQGGRLIIPSVFRKSLNLKDGEVVMVQLHGNMLQVRTIDDTLDAVQARYSKLPGPGSIVKEFLKERREEAAREAED